MLWISNCIDTYVYVDRRYGFNISKQGQVEFNNDPSSKDAAKQFLRMISIFMHCCPANQKL